MESSRPSALEHAFAKAMDQVDVTPLVDPLERAMGNSPNWGLLRTFALRMAGRPTVAKRLLPQCITHSADSVRCLAVFSYGACIESNVNEQEAYQALELLAEDTKLVVRQSVVSVLRDLVVGKTAKNTLLQLTQWMDGFLQAHVVLDALADKAVLDQFRHSDDVMAFFTMAFDLADQSSRSAERLQGVRTLRGEMPRQIAKLAQRFAETLDWLAERTRAKRPETREVIRNAIDALEKSSFSKAELHLLRNSLQATEPLPRDPSRVVSGTRKRGK